MKDMIPKRARSGRIPPSKKQNPWLLIAALFAVGGICFLAGASIGQGESPEEEGSEATQENIQVDRVDARIGKFDSIWVNKIIVTEHFILADKNNKPMVGAQVLNGGGQLIVSAESGKASVSISATGAGGVLTIMDSSGKAVAGLAAGNKDGAQLGLYGDWPDSGRSNAQIAVKNGKPVLQMQDENGRVVK